MGKIFIWIILCLMLVSGVSAYSIDTLETDFYLFKNNLVIETEIILSDYIAEFEWQLPEDASAVSVYADGSAADFTLADNRLKIQLNQERNIKFNYVTSEFIDNENFLISFRAPAEIANLKFRVVLPEEATLKKPIQEETISSGSVYPNPQSSTTDGRSLIFEWVRSQLKEGDEMSIYLSYKLSRSYSILIAVLIGLVIITFLAAIFMFFKRPKIIEKIVKETEIEKHLKEDEEVIVNVLKKRDNKQCEQGTLRIITGYSKATLSRLLKELEERKVIRKEKRGKKNIIFLK